MNMKRFHGFKGYAHLIKFILNISFKPFIYDRTVKPILDGALIFDTVEIFYYFTNHIICRLGVFKTANIFLSMLDIKRRMW